MNNGTDIASHFRQLRARSRGCAGKRPGRRLAAGLYGIALLFVIFLAGCRHAPENARASAAAQPEIPFARLNEISVIEAQAAPVAGELLIPAALSLDDIVVVNAPRAGSVQGLGVNEGSRVSAGETLALFDVAELRNQLQQASLDIERAQVEEKQYAAAVSLSRNELEREQYLFKEGVTSQAEVERVQFRLDQTQKEYEKIRLATRLAQAKANAVQLEMSKAAVKSPISGFVIKRYCNEGSSVAANEKLYELSRLTPVKLKFQVPQTANIPLRPGQLVSISLAGSNRIIASARIVRPEPIADAASNTYGYVADLTGNSGLRPGVAVNVHLSPSNSGQAVLVPRIVFPPDTKIEPGAAGTVMVVEKNRVVARDVLIQGTEGDQVLLRAGLVPGDRVIIAPSPVLKTGDTVTIR